MDPRDPRGSGPGPFGQQGPTVGGPGVGVPGVGMGGNQRSGNSSAKCVFGMIH